MSTVIKEISTCSTREEYEQESQKIKTWFQQVLQKKWSPVSTGNVTLSDVPSENNHHFIRTQTNSKLSPKELFDKIVKADFETVKKYDKDLLVFEVLENVGGDDNIKIVRQCHSAPWPITSREFITLSNNYEENGVYYIIQGSINYPNYDKVDKKYVRGLKNLGMVIKPEGDGCSVERVMEIDPKGSVPSIAVSTSKKDDATRLLKLKEYFEVN
ncbi:START domain-containing protein [Entamoeba marina]